MNTSLQMRREDFPLFPNIGIEGYKPIVISRFTLNRPLYPALLSADSYMGVYWLYSNDAQYPCFLIDDNTTVDSLKAAWPTILKMRQSQSLKASIIRASAGVLALPFPKNKINAIGLNNRKLYPCFIADIDSTREQFVDAWWEIKILRNALREIQGPTGRISILFDCEKRFSNDGYHYGEIAELLNRHMLALLYELTIHMLIIAKKSSLQIKEHEELNHLNYIGAIRQEIRWICDDLGVVEEKEDWTRIEAAHELLANGETVSEWDFFTKERVRLQLLAHRRRVKTNNMLLKTEVPAFKFMNGPSQESLETYNTLIASQRARRSLAK